MSEVRVNWDWTMINQNGLSWEQYREPVDTELARYVDGLGNWVRASGQWGFESERYFGKKGPEIEKNRWVRLSPKGRSEDVGPQLVDDAVL
jgi:hypothetical protein